MWQSEAVREGRRDVETALNSLKCVVYENHFAKSELCGKEKAVGICMCGGKGGVSSAKREGSLICC